MVCMYVCMYDMVCIYVWYGMYVCMYVCMIWYGMYVCIYDMVWYGMYVYRYTCMCGFFELLDSYMRYVCKIMAIWLGWHWFSQVTVDDLFLIFFVSLC